MSGVRQCEAWLSPQQRGWHGVSIARTSRPGLLPGGGGVLIFKDLHHVTLPWAETFGPPLAAHP